jgi:hypothetical protein
MSRGLHSISTEDKRDDKIHQIYARFGSRDQPEPSQIRVHITTLAMEGSIPTPGRDTVQALDSTENQFVPRPASNLLYDGRGTRRLIDQLSWRMHLRPLQTEYLIADIYRPDWHISYPYTMYTVTIIWR